MSVENQLIIKQINKTTEYPSVKGSLSFDAIPNTKPLVYPHSTFRSIIHDPDYIKMISEDEPELLGIEEIRYDAEALPPLNWKPNNNRFAKKNHKNNFKQNNEEAYVKANIDWSNVDFFSQLDFQNMNSEDSAYWIEQIKIERDRLEESIASSASDLNVSSYSLTPQAVNDLHNTAHLTPSHHIMDTQNGSQYSYNLLMTAQYANLANILANQPLPFNSTMQPPSGSQHWNNGYGLGSQNIFQYPTNELLMAVQHANLLAQDNQILPFNAGMQSPSGSQQPTSGYAINASSLNSNNSRADRQVSFNSTMQQQSNSQYYSSENTMGVQYRNFNNSQTTQPFIDSNFMLPQTNSQIYASRSMQALQNLSASQLNANPTLNKNGKTMLNQYRATAVNNQQKPESGAKHQSSRMKNKG